MNDLSKEIKKNFKLLCNTDGVHSVVAWIEEDMESFPNLKAEDVDWGKVDEIMILAASDYLFSLNDNA